MLLAIEIILAILALAVPTLVVLVLVLYRDHPDQTPVRAAAEVSQTMTLGAGIPMPPRVRPMYTVEDPGIWWLELAGSSPAQRAARLFSGHVVLGRTLPFESAADRLYVGEDPTVSRDQCVLFSYGGALWAVNLSGVNVTRINGVPVEQPTAVHPGDRITMGNTRMIFRAVRAYLI